MVLIIGDSHTRVIALGQEELPQNSPARDYNVHMLGIGRTFLRKFHETTDDGVTLLGPRKQEILKHAIDRDYLTEADTPVFLSLGFHGIYFYHSKLWNEYTILSNENSRQFISDSAFRLMALRFNYHILSFIDALKSKGIQPVVVSAPYLPRKFVDTPKIESVTSEELTIIENSFRAVMTDALNRRKVPVLLPPDEATDSGYLKEKYRRTDDTYEYHGNPAYGALVLKQIEEYLRASHK